MHIKHKLLRLMGKIPLQVIFIVPFVLQIVLIVGIVGYISFRNGQRAVNSLISELQDEISLRIEDRLDQYLTAPHLLNQAQANTIELGQIGAENAELLIPYFWQNLKLLEDLNATFFGTEDGVMVGARRLSDAGLEVMLASESTNQSLNYYLPNKDGFPDEFVTGAADYDPRQRSWYTEALILGRPHWSPIYLDFETGMPVITAGQPVYGEDGEPLGVLGSAFQFEQVNDFLTSLDIGEHGQTFIMDREGTFVSTSSGASISRLVDDQLSRLFVAESEDLVERETAVSLKRIYGDLNTIQDAQDLTIPIDGQKHHIRVTPKRDKYGLDWLVVLIIPSSDFMTEIQANNRITIYMIILSLIGAVFIGIITTRWVTRPLRQLRDVALAYSDGNWDARVPMIEREDELGLLATTFNQMAAQLQHSFADLAQSQERYESMFNYVPIMLFEEDFSAVKMYIDHLKAEGITDLDAYFTTNPSALHECACRVKILAVNQAVVDTTQFTAAELMTGLDQFLTEDEHDVFQRELIALAEGNAYFEAESTMVQESGNVIHTYFRLAIVPGYEETWARVLLSIEDITNRVLLEKQVQGQQRLAAVGQLAAGIAHDFNNILSSITLYADLLERTLPDDSPKNKKYLDTITRQTERAAQLTQQILDFGRQSPLQRNPMNILRSLQDLLDLFRRTLPENIKLKLTYDRDVYIADIDPTRFQQLFMNLAVNARDAMPDGGTLSFTITYKVFLPTDTRPVANMQAGNWVQIEVADTGIGIAEAEVARVFEPFFTTKPPGKGTGLGLAQVYGIVTQHDGFITLESELNYGTKFTIYLPLLAEGEEKSQDWVFNDVKGGDGEIILVVEDDEPTRDAIVTALDILNYQTIVAENGRKAIDYIQHSDSSIALVLTDMLMPEMTGLELVSFIRKQGYLLPVVILTGYVLEDDLEKMRRLNVTGWLNKPPNLQQLASLLRQGLNQSQEAM